MTNPKPSEDGSRSAVVAELIRAHHGDCLFRALRLRDPAGGMHDADSL
jgi:hypothetical protein